MKTSLIVAADDNDVIGLGNTLPWHLPEDLKRFKARTTGHVVVAGRRTHDSIVARLGHPLPGRFTVAVTRQAGLAGDAGVTFEPSVAAALRVARSVEAFAGRDEIFIIGGGQVYAETLAEVTRVYLTRVHEPTVGDVVMPKGWLDGFSLVEQEEGQVAPVTFYVYERG